MWRLVKVAGDMLDYTRSVVSFSLAATMGGAAEIAGWLPRPDRIGTPAGELAEMLRLMGQAAGDVERDLRAWQPSTGGGGRIDPRLLEGVRRTCRELAPGADGTATWLEMLNKLDVYRLVRRAGRIVPWRREGLDLPGAVESAYALDHHDAMWLVEGLAHDFVLRRCRRHEALDGVLALDGSRRPPPASLLMLHAGMGLAFAEHLFSSVRAGAGRSALRRAVERYVAWCEAHSEPGFAPAALESLGLYVRCFRPELLAPLDRLVAARDDDLRVFFWHGAGRAVYFLPVQYLPGYGTMRHALEMVEREAPDRQACDDARAGLGWAFTVVNLRHPLVMERFLMRDGGRIEATRFADAIVDSVVSRHDTTPGARWVLDFCRHRPSSPAVAALWERLITRPCEEALAAEREPFDLVLPRRYAC